MRRAVAHLVFFSGIFLLGSGALSAQTIFVDGTNTNPVQTGTGWNRAFSNLRDALAIAQSGNLVVVAESSYSPFDLGSYMDTFDVPIGITLEGGYLPGDPVGAPTGSVNNTILDGDIGGIDVYHVVRIIGSGPGPQTTLKSLTIMNGDAFGNNIDEMGGGLLTMNALVQLEDCQVVNNRAYWGGGVAIVGSGRLNLKRCAVNGNTAVIRGGGVYADYAEFNAVNCVVAQNSADVRGGGIALSRTGALSSQLMNCLVVDNQAGRGGGFDFAGGGSGAGAKLINCTVADNSAVISAGALFAGAGSNPVVRNSILWDNGISPIVGIAKVRQSDVEGGYAGNGVVNIDPLFPFAGDYHVSEPVLFDAGNTGAVPDDELDIDDDGDFTETTPIDLEGKLRIKGAGVGLGVYERG